MIQLPPRYTYFPYTPLFRSPYAIPTDEPYAGPGAALDEIWASGLRNPWRFSFDRLTGDMYIADVGQFNWDEIGKPTSELQSHHVLLCLLLLKKQNNNTVHLSE